MTFARRLSTVLAGRRLAPWALRLGLGRAALDAMRAGRMPARAALQRICRAEGIRWRWLVDGQGPPYTVARSGSDEATAIALETMLDSDPAWRRFLVTDGHSSMVVLTQPAVLEQPSCPYTIVAVLGGEVGARTIAALGARGRYREVGVDWRTLESIRNARLGPYALVGDLERPGLLAGARRPVREA